MVNDSRESKSTPFDSVLGEYMRRIDGGESLDRERFVAEHPDFEPELREYFETEDRLAEIGLAVEEANDPERSQLDTAVHSLAAEDTRVPSGSAEVDPPGGESFDRYLIVKTLGEGAMGSVHLAEDTMLKREVALKLPKFGHDDPEMLERFLVEARAAANLRHPNICPVHDVGEFDGRYFITMAYIPGRPLSDYAKTKTRQKVRQIVKVVRKLALALHVAHEAGIVHRDVKPANVMIDEQGEPVVMDFGLARHTTQEEGVRLTRSGAVMGTPAYMAPEQVEGRIDDVGPASDQFSLGAVLYEMLTGELPFPGTSMGVVMSKIMNDDPAPPNTLRPEVDPLLDDICLRMMAKGIEARYGSMREVAEALTEWLQQDKGLAIGSGGDTRETAAFADPGELTTPDRPVVAEGTQPVVSPDVLVSAPNLEFPQVSIQVEPESVTDRVRPTPRRSRSVPTWAWMTGAAAVVALAAVLLIPTPEGTLRVEVEDGADVEVLVDGEAIKLADDSAWQADVDAKKHRLSLRIAGTVVPFDGKSKRFVAEKGKVTVSLGGVDLADETFEVTRGGTTVVRISFVPDSTPTPSHERFLRNVYTVERKGESRAPLAVATDLGVCTVFPRDHATEYEIVSLDRTERRTGTVVARSQDPSLRWITPESPLDHVAKRAASGSHRREQPGFLVEHVRDEPLPVVREGRVEANGTFVPKVPRGPRNSGEQPVGPVFNEAGELLGFGVKLKNEQVVRLFPADRDASVRAIAERIIGLGGWVAYPGGPKTVVEIADLPPGTFEIVRVGFPNRVETLPEDVLASLSSIPTLEEVGLAKGTVSERGVAELAGIRSLKALHFRGMNINDAGLASLAKLPNLEFMRLVQTDVTDDGLKVLADMSLTGMSLGSWNEDSRVTDAGLAHLAGARKLKDLWLYGPAFTDDSIEHLVRMPGLRNLHLYTPNITDAGIESLRKQLKKVSDRRGEPVPDEDMDPAETDPGETIDNGSDREIAELLDGLGGFVKPVGGGKYFDDLPDGDFRVEGVSFFRKQRGFKNGHIALLAKLPELKAVWFYDSEMDDDGFATLGEMENVVENVTELHFHRSAFGPKGLAALTKLRSLTNLDLWHTDLINDDLKLLAKMGELRELTLFQHSKRKFGPAFLTDDCLKHLAAIPKLETLNLTGQQFTDAGLPAVAAIEGLETVRIKGTRVTEEAIAELKRLRPRLGVIYDPSDQGDDDEP